MGLPSGDGKHCNIQRQNTKHGPRSVVPEVLNPIPVHTKHPLNETMVDVGNSHIPLGPFGGCFIRTGDGMNFDPILMLLGGKSRVQQPNSFAQIRCPESVFTGLLPGLPTTFALLGIAPGLILLVKHLLLYSEVTYVDGQPPLNNLIPQVDIIHPHEAPTKR